MSSMPSSRRRAVGLAVASVALLVACVAGCGQARDTVTAGPGLTTAPPNGVSAVATSGGGPPPSTTVGPRVPASSSTTAAAPTSVATTAPRPTTTVVATTAAPTTTTAVANPVRVLGVDCARHPDEGGDWLVFHLASLDATATVAYGSSPVTVAGDNTLLVTITPAVDASAGRYGFASACDHVNEVAVAGQANGTLTWVVGTKGRPRVLNTPAPAPSLRGAALVVKLGP